jgi:hypothetical protein
MRQSEDLRFGGVLLEAALADLRPTAGAAVSARRKRHTDTLKRCAADHGRTRV